MSYLDMSCLNEFASEVHQHVYDPFNKRVRNCKHEHDPFKIRLTPDTTYSTRITKYVWCNYNFNLIFLNGLMDLTHKRI